MVPAGRSLKLELRCGAWLGRARFPIRKVNTMTVIAKMNMSKTDYADGTKLNLHCVYDTELAKGENEDVRFTKATPWGQAELIVDADVALPEWPYANGPVYVMFTEAHQPPLLSECFVALEAVCASVLDTGVQKQIELTGWRYPDDSPVPVNKRGSRFSLKMGVDNPAASIQFVPQKRYWIALMDASDRETVDVMGMARVEGNAE